MLYAVNADLFRTLHSDELRLIHKIYIEICRQPWFNEAEKQKLATYIVAMYQRGMVDPKKLKQLSMMAARENFARRGTGDRGMVNAASSLCARVGL
jgi:hypothetical protein